jgi:hypothetical protein
MHPQGMSVEARLAVAVERIAALDRLVTEHWEAHDALHASDIRTHDREVELADQKFAKANEVREQIDRERNTFSTNKEVQEARDLMRSEIDRTRQEADLRFKGLEERITREAGEKAGRTGITSPLMAAAFTAGGALLLFILERILTVAPTR